MLSGVQNFVVGIHAVISRPFRVVPGVAFSTAQKVAGLGSRFLNDLLILAAIRGRVAGSNVLTLGVVVAVLFIDTARFTYRPVAKDIGCRVVDVALAYFALSRNTNFAIAASLVPLAAWVWMTL